MQSRRPDIQVPFFITPMQQPECQYIRQQPHDGNHHHCHTRHGLWMIKALDCFPDDKKSNQHQRNGVNKGGEGGQTKPAKGASWPGRAVGEMDGQQGKKERGGIRQHMPGIGQ